MAKRFTDTEIWDKQWFMELPPKLKCLVKYVRDKSDLAGVWHPNWKLANIYIGEKVTEEMLLKIDGGKQFMKLGNGKINCIDFISFQYGKLSEKSPVHRKILQILDDHKIGYLDPIYRVQEEEEDKEEEKEEEEAKEKDKQKPSLEERKTKFLMNLSLFRNDHTDSTLQEFGSYWTEHNPDGNLMRFEKETVFDTQRRLSTWKKNEQKFKRNASTTEDRKAGLAAYKEVAERVLNGGKT